MKKFILICFLFLSCMGVSWAQSKQEKKEIDYPKTFLKIYNCERFVPLIGKSEYFFDISNSATIVTYFEIVIKIKFINKNRVVVGEEFHTLNGYLEPQTYKRFPIKSSEPSPFIWSTYSYEIITAKGINDFLD